MKNKLRKTVLSQLTSQEPETKAEIDKNLLDPDSQGKLSFLGGAFSEQSVKAEAQKILVQAEQIEAAMIAYKLDHNGVITLGESGDLSNNEILEFYETY